MDHSKIYMAEAFKNLINKLSSEAPKEIDLKGTILSNPDGVFECQVILANGATMAGAMSKTDIEGLYSLRSPMRVGDARTGPVVVVDNMFTAEAIFVLTVPLKKEVSRIVTPEGGAIVGLPGR